MNGPFCRDAYTGTRGSLDVKHLVWRQLLFKKKEVEAIWRNAVVHLLRDNYVRINPGGLPGLGHIRKEDRWHRYLQAQYRRSWKVHFAKKTRGAWRSEKYLGRYLKRPPVAASQLRQCSGPSVLRSPYAAAQTPENQLGGDAAALRQPYSGAAF
ncbi:transposase [Serratia odorifera]|uniref:transposase n=1 Tax=Serratia odorifera TaxID=618 RepID=UPI003D2AA5E9